MMAKNVRLSEKSRQKLVEGINIVANAVKVTLGPKVIIYVIPTFGTQFSFIFHSFLFFISFVYFLCRLFLFIYFLMSLLDTTKQNKNRGAM